MIPNFAKTQQEIVRNVMLFGINLDSFREMHPKVFIINTFYKVSATRFCASNIVIFVMVLIILGTSHEHVMLYPLSLSKTNGLVFWGNASLTSDKPNAF